MIETGNNGAFHFEWRPGATQGRAQQPPPRVGDSEPIAHPAVADARRRLLPDGPTWAYRTATVGDGGELPPGVQRNIALFNVIVALEWQPDAGYLETLSRAFGEASALLYDVTDGYMAIERVVVGAGAEWLAVADIQILTSNRLLPRARVSGLLDPRKYRPIRLGRGLWSKQSHRLTPWSGAYGAIVHEWGHYALGLKDQYLETLTVEADGARAGLVVPSLGLLTASIMAGDMQTELTGADVPIMAEGRRPTPLANRRRALQTSDPALAAMTEWAQLARDFGILGIEADHVPQDAPPAIVPIPEFFVDASAQGERRALAFAPPLSDLERQHCWVYLRRQPEGDAGTVLQGVIGDAGELDLLGADEGDEVIMLFRGEAGGGQVRRGLRAALNAGKAATIAVPDWPMVAVTAALPGGGQPQIHVEPTPGVQVARVAVSSDDGDGVVSVDLAGGATILAQFSQGGSPDSAYPAHPNPIPSGSDDGNVRIFFHDSAIKRPGDPASADYADYHLLTTTNYHVAAPGWGEPRSYVFGVTANHSLRELGDAARLRPTLILAFDKATSGDGDRKLDLAIYRHDGRGDWEPLPSTVFDDRSFIAAPLTADTAPGLFAEPPRAEFFRILGG